MQRNIAIGSVQPKPLRTSAINVLMMVMGLLIFIGIGTGIYAQVVGHHHAFATSRSIPWGMPIAVYAYFAIISTGLCIMAAITHLFHIKPLEPLANRMVWLSIIMLLSAFFVIGLELENVWRMPLGVILNPNFSSNIWWMGALYGAATVIMLVEFTLIFTGKFKAALALGISAAVVEVLANSNLGSVFASISARSFWYGAQLPIFFLACAFLSGAAAVVLFTHYAHLIKGRRMEEEVFGALQFAGRLMMIMLFLVSLSTVWKYANALCGTEETRTVAMSLINGHLAGNFWIFEIGIGLAAPFILLAVSRLRSLQALSLAALMVLVGQFVSRLNLVAAGLTVPQLGDYAFDVPAYLSYSPSISEILLVVGGFGIMGFGFLFGEKVFFRLLSCYRNVDYS